MHVARSFARRLVPLCLSLACLPGGQALAQDGDADSAPFAPLLEGWSGTASIGATSATGAAESSNINASLRISKAYDRWEHTVYGLMFKGSSTIVVSEEREDGTTERRIVKGDNSDRIALGYQPKYYFRENTYLFGLLDWETDEPANIDSSFRQVIGVGHRFWRNESGFFAGEIGIGNKSTDPVSGEDITGGIGYLGLNYRQRLAENLTFNADLRSDFGSENTFVEIGLGLTASLSDRLNANITHFTRNNSDLDSGDNPLDSGSSSVTTFNLVLDI